MLDGQVVRATLKSYDLFASAPARPLGSHSNYLRLLRTPDQPNRPVINATTWQDHAAIAYLLEWRAALAVESAAQNLEHPDPGINRRLSKAVTDAFVATQVGTMVSDLNQLPQNEASALGDIYLLVRLCHSVKLTSLFTLNRYIQYLLITAEEALADFFTFGLLQRGPDQTDPTRHLRAAINAVCLRILPNAVGFTDAFSFPDWSLDRFVWVYLMGWMGRLRGLCVPSALGVSSGRVYEELWKRVQLEPLNQTDGTPGYEVSHVIAV